MPVPPLDDRALEALLNGAPPAQSGFDWLLPFVEDLDRAAQEPAPVVRPALAVLLREGFTPADRAPVPAPAPGRAPAGSRPTLRAAMQRVAGLGVLAKVGLGASVALAGTTGAGAAGVLPDPAQHAIATVVAATTPFTFPDTTGKAPRTPVVSAPPGTPPGGVAGNGGPPSSLPPSSRGVAGSPADNGVGANPGVTGLDRANQTPAAGHAPTSSPGGGRPEQPGSTPGNGNGQGPPASTPAVTAPAVTAPAVTAPRPTPPGPPSTVSTGSAGRDTAATTPAATRPSQP